MSNLSTSTKDKATDKLMTNSTHPEGQSRSSGLSDPVKQTADQILLFDVESQCLASRMPKVLASF